MVKRTLPHKDFDVGALHDVVCDYPAEPTFTVWLDGQVIVLSNPDARQFVKSWIGTCGRPQCVRDA